MTESCVQDMRLPSLRLQTDIYPNPNIKHTVMATTAAENPQAQNSSSNDSDNDNDDEENDVITLPSRLTNGDSEAIEALRHRL